LAILRNGTASTLSLVPEELPASMPTATNQTDGGDRQQSNGMGAMGLEYDELTPEIAKQLGEPGIQGVVITQVEPGSDADRAGLRPGMIITQADRQDISSVSQFHRILKEGKEDLLLLVRANGASRFIVLQHQSQG
jgi:serine protease Do